MLGYFHKINILGFILYFFLLVKTKCYKKEKFQREHRKWTKGSQTYKRQERNPKNYLQPIHVRNSKTEFVVSLPNRLAQLHKLEIKINLILWAEVTLFSNASLFLACQIVQNRHKGAADQIFFRFFPTAIPCQAKRV